MVSTHQPPPSKLPGRTPEAALARPATYPVEREAEVVLRDGSLAHVRPIRPDDEPGLLAFLRALPDDDRGLRFFSLGTDLARTAHEEAEVDYTRSFGLLATVGPDERVVGHALYARSGEGRAEVAFAIARDHQGRGLASLLLGHLAEVASAHGIHTFEAIVLPENRRMLEVFRDSGFPVQTRYAAGSVELSMPTSLSPEGLARFEQRDEQAAASGDLLACRLPAATGTRTEACEAAAWRAR
jgi:GNAT superfamily N-acetyltransferase